MNVRVLVSTERTLRPFQLESKEAYLDSINIFQVKELISDLQKALKQYKCIPEKEELLREALKQYKCIPEKEELLRETLEQYERGE